MYVIIVAGTHSPTYFSLQQAWPHPGGPKQCSG